MRDDTDGTAPGIDRRTYLAAAAAAGVGLAGCSGGDGGGGDGGDSGSGDGDSGEGGSDDTPEPTDSPTDSPTPEPSFAREWEATLGSFRLTGNNFSGAYADGRLFVAARDGALYAVSAADGSVLWEFTGESGYGDVAATADLAFVTFEGGMVALAADTGEEAWRKSADGGDLVATTGDLVVRDGGAAEPSPVYDAASGDRLRSLEYGGGYHMLADASTGYLFSGAGANTRSYDLATGEERWRTSRPLSRQPALAGGDLVKTADGSFVVYAGDTGEVTEVPAGNVGGATVSAAGTAIATDTGAGTVYGIDPAAGSVSWTAEVSDQGFIPPAVVGSQVLLEGGPGVVALDATSGERTGETSVSGIGTAGLVGGDSRLFRAYRDGGEALVAGFSVPATE